MPTLDEANFDVLFTMLKGEPGTRKSTCALSYPTPQYWISTDQKMEALTLPMKRWGINPKDIKYDDYNDWNGPQSKLKQFELSCPFKSIIVDSVTSIADCMTGQVRKKKSSEGGGKMIGGINVDGLEEYNAESGAFKDLMARLKDIHKFHKVNIILIAHVVGQRKDDDSNKLTHHSRVIITGGDKIAGKIASYMTEVYHFNVEPGFAETDEGHYTLYTSHMGNDYARTSLPLERKITFDNRPLYDDFVKPAIEKLKAEKPIQRITTNTQPPPPPPTSNVTPFKPQ